MPLIVEDGTGLDDAESYVSVAEADTYHTARGAETTWTDADSDLKEQALRKATEYIDSTFGGRLRSARSYPDTPQALEFPRELWGDAVPVNLKKATFEYAIRALTAPLAPDPTVDASGLLVVSTNKELGPLKKAVQFRTAGYGATPITERAYPAADKWMREFLRNANRVVR